jgi:hypothetical protein
MNNSSMLTLSLFLIAWAVGVAAWLFLVAETIAMWRLSPWVFRFGPAMVIRELSLPAPRTPKLDVVEEIGNAKVRWNNERECIFRRRFFFFRFQFHTSMPVKCTLRWEGSRALFTARAPLGSIVFLAAWLTGWTTASLGFPSTNLVGGRLGSLAFGWGIAGVISIVSILVEKRRADSMFEDVATHLVGAAA